MPGIELELVPSGGGVFEVDVDGQRIHSKKKTGRFPDPARIVADLKAAKIPGASAWKSPDGMRVRVYVGRKNSMVPIEITGPTVTIPKPSRSPSRTRAASRTARR